MRGETGTEDEGKLIRSTPPKVGKHYVRNAFYIIAGSVLSLYATAVLFTKGWTPKQMREYGEKERIKIQIESEHKSEADYNYGRIFENAKTFQDSVDIYKKYGLPIKLLTPSAEQKEKAIKQNELERSIK